MLAYPRGVRTTPWHERFLDHGAELTESAGWERAQWFRANDALPLPAVMPERSAWAQRHWSPTIGREHHATRTGVGVFDLTPFVKVEAEGPGVVEWLNRVCASEMDRPVGRILYTTVLDHDGGCVCDLTVTRLGDERYLLVTGGGSGPRDVAWLRSELPEGDSVRLRDVSSSLGVLGLWGPRSGELLARLSPDDLSLPLPRARARSGSAPCRRWRCASRTRASSAGSSTRRPSTAATSGISSSRPAPTSASWPAAPARSTRCAWRRATASPAST